MTVPEFVQLLEGSGIRKIRVNDVDIEFTSNIMASIRIWDLAPAYFTLYVEQETADFIRDLKICSKADLEAIDEQALWKQYRNGNGCVWAALDYDTDLNVSFQIVDGTTVIEGFNIPFREELPEILDTVAQCRAYVREHMTALYRASEKKAEALQR